MISAFLSTQLGISSLCGEGGLEIEVSAFSSSWLSIAVLWWVGWGRELEMSAGLLREVLVVLVAMGVEK